MTNQVAKKFTDPHRLHQAALNQQNGIVIDTLIKTTIIDETIFNKAFGLIVE